MSTAKKLGGVLNVKQKGRKAVKQKIKVFRSSDPIVAVMEWAVRHLALEMHDLSAPTVLLGNHFKAFSKIKVESHHYKAPNLPIKFKVKFYCPEVFRELRERFGVSDEQYVESLCDETLELNQDHKDAGRSGATFYETGDGLLVLKSMKKLEVAQMHMILPAYHKYIVEQGGATLLPQFMGMYRLTVDDKETYMLTMRNVVSATLAIDERYDLKGSLLKRTADEKELQKETPTFKDNDFRAANRLLHLSDASTKAVIERVERDTDFLASLRLMDYSFLVGIHVCDENPDDPTDNEESIQRAITDDIYAIPSRLVDHPEIYYLGIIDILTPYDAGKRVAHTAKTLRNGPHAEPSTVNPERYRTRFLEFIRAIFSDDETPHQCSQPPTQSDSVSVEGEKE